MNLVALTGRLTADPVLSKSTSGVSVTAFSIAVSRNYKKEGGQEADYIRVVAWRNTAEFICRYFRKGTKIEISGELQSRMYKEKDTGKNKTIMEVVANQVNFAESKSSGENKPSSISLVEPDISSTHVATKSHISPHVLDDVLDEDGFVPFDEDDGDLPF